MRMIIDIDEETYIKAQAGILGSFGEIIANGKPYEERPQGKWVVDGTMYRGGKISSITYRCNLCRRRITWINIESGKTNEEFLQEYPFCHCGADMRGVEDPSDMV